MPHSPAHHHLHKRKRLYKYKEPLPHPNNFMRFIDHLTILMSFVVALGTASQAWKIWFYETAEGVSLTAFSIYVVSALTWLTYGILHKEIPLIINGVMLAAIDLIVVIGIVTYV
jgi:uncharacterized protein with PQ loop repeat